jgi:DNA replication and repair protein RecF
MRITRLRLENFRSYERLDWNVPDGVVALIGANGQGKTNLLEALHLALTGGCFRALPTSSSCIRDGAAMARVHLDLERLGLMHDLEWRQTSTQRHHLHQGRRTTSTPLRRLFPIVMFSPESLAAIKEGPEVRRQLVDEALITHDPESLRVLNDWKRVLRARSRVLKDQRYSGASLTVTQDLLDSLDASYLPLATEISVKRLKALDDLALDIRACAKQLFLGEDVHISVEYVISGQNAQGWSRSDILSAMHKRAQELRSSELSSGRCLVGAHKHDIRILYNGKDSRFFCSQGQQRALILSFKMAQIMYHYRSYQVYPFLLLDDVLSELDLERRVSLMRQLKNIPAQIFLTTTDLSFPMDFESLKPSVFKIADGCVQRSS